MHTAPVLVCIGMCTVARIAGSPGDSGCGQPLQTALLAPGLLCPGLARGQIHVAAHSHFTKTSKMHNLSIAFGDLAAPQMDLPYFLQESCNF